MSDNDESIQATNDDATLCKAYAVKLRYWDDPFLQYFAKQTNPKAPEINRGYYIRTQLFKAYVDLMINTYGTQTQIVNLGAGFDTLYLRLVTAGHTAIKVIDVDLPFNSSRKVQSLLQKKPLSELIKTNAVSEISHNRTDLHAEPYHIIGADLRVLAEFEAKLKACDIDFEKPTIFLSECVLVYMDADSSTSLLQFIAKLFPTACFLLYEQVNMEDRFGETMLRNLNERGCSLAGITMCKSLDSQKTRFTSVGWKQAMAWNINEVYRSFPRSAIERMEKIEHLDECEVMQQLFDHYCFVVGSSEQLQIDNLFDLRSVTSIC